jgi:hypothetical protein
MEERARITKNEVLRRVRAEAEKSGYRAALESVFTPAPQPVAPAPKSSRRLVRASERSEETHGAPTTDSAGGSAGVLPAHRPTRGGARSWSAALVKSEEDEG